MKRKRLLDSYAMIAYLNKERGFNRVRDLMSMAQKSGDSILINEMNVGEVFYILFRKRGPQEADYFLETILAALPVSTVSNGFDDVIGAARFKCEYPLSYVDCFVAATAQKMNAVILTSDPDFKKIEHLVSVEWLDS